MFNLNLKICQHLTCSYYYSNQNASFALYLLRNVIKILTTKTIPSGILSHSAWSKLKFSNLKSQEFFFLTLSQPYLFPLFCFVFLISFSVLTNFLITDITLPEEFTIQTLPGQIKN